jgi:hypothetical protein
MCINTQHKGDNDDNNNNKPVIIGATGTISKSLRLPEQHTRKL